MGSARFLKLADHELADARRGTPVDGAPVVARDVFTQGMEGHVSGGQILRGRSFDVADETDRRGVHGDRSRVDVELGGIGPCLDAADQAEAVAADRGGRAHGHDASPRRRDCEDLLVVLVPSQRRAQERVRARADAQLDHGGAQAPSRGVGDCQRAEGFLADRHARVGEPQCDGVPCPAQGPQEGEGHQGQAREAQDRCLDPREQDARQGGSRPDDRRSPAEHSQG